jgi:hypothetical protein
MPLFMMHGASVVNIADTSKHEQTAGTSRKCNSRSHEDGSSQQEANDKNDLV